MIHNKLGFRLSCLALLVAGGGVSAQDVQVNKNKARPLLDEIIVTAQKRQQSTNDVGMSISAFTGDTLAERNITDPSELNRIVPGFTATRSNFDFPTYTLRGVGFYESSLSAAPTVSVYTDEAPLPYPSMASGALLDLERIEVLKGPQGILFGQNSTGGAINYIAAKPTDEFSAGISATYARFGAVETEGHISGALSDTVAARLAVRTEQGGAWQKSVTRPNDELGDKDFTTARLLVDITPSDTLRFSVNLNGWRDKGDSKATQTTEIIPVNPAFTVSPDAVSGLVTTSNSRLADWTPDLKLEKDKEFYQGALRAEWDATDDFTITSLTSYQRYEQFSIEDADGGVARTIDIAPGGEVKSFSQELRASGEAFDDSVIWVVGANYQSDKIDEEQIITQGESTGSFVDLGAAQPFHFVSIANQAVADIESHAVFGNVDISVSDIFSVQLGLRYTSTENDYTGCVADSGADDFASIFRFLQSAFNAPVTAQAGECVTLLSDFSSSSVSDSLKEDNVSYRLGVNWTPFGDDTLLYANVSQGYKSGSFPTVAATLAVQLEPVTQEKVVAYEAGFKASLTEYDIQLNGAAFYYDYKNKQFRGRIQDPIFGQLERLVNIPESRIQGAELQMLWRPMASLTLVTNLSFVDSEILGNFANFPQRTNPPIPFNGNKFPYTPEWQASFDAEYEIDISSDIIGFVGGSVTYQSDSKAALENSDPSKPTNLLSTAGASYNDPALHLPDYTLVDLRLGLKSADDTWRTSFWAKNVTDEYYVVNAINNRDTLNRYVGLPASYGLTVNYNF